MADESPWPYRAFLVGSAVFSAIAGRVIFGRGPGSQARVDMGARFQIAKALVDKWAAVLTRVPSTVVLAIMSHESGYNPSALNMTGKDADRGGAYGLLQVTAETAAEVAKTLAGINIPSVTATLKKYDAKAPRSLLDPDLNVLMGMGYLNILAKAYNNDSNMVVAAYNRGRKGASSVLATKGKAGIASLPYVVAVNQVRQQLEQSA